MSNLPKNCRLDDVLLPFDKILIKDDSLRGKNTYKGTIHEAIGNTVYFTHNIRGRHLTPGNNFSLSFSNNRLYSKYQNTALQLTSKALISYLFPKLPCPYSSSKYKITSFFNQEILKNPEQIQAVENISSNAKLNHCPYILFGPPGTGKTSTVVESILQIFTNNPNAKILVSTFSNTACDQVGRRLFSYLQNITNEPVLLRIYSICYGDKIDYDVEDNYMEATNMCHVYHMFPSINTIKTYRIVLATHYIIGKYVHSGLKDNFTHIFIDENASTTIPDAMCAIAGIWTPKVKVILSGDPKQLGPILKNDRSVKLGFDISLMERIMENPAYKGENYNIAIQTRLVKNFRSHPKLLEIFSKRFYGGTLEPCAPLEKTERFIGWKYLPNKDIPLIFHECSGKSLMDEDGPSLYNTDEIEIVMKYINILLKKGVEETDIGIVSPYRKQYSIIKSRLEKARLNYIEVGSPEIFQGKEKPVIIASTVRSNTETIGFLNNQRVSFFGNYSQYSKFTNSKTENNKIKILS